MRHKSLSTLLVLGSVLSAWPFGCQPQESEKEPEPARQWTTDNVRLDAMTKKSMGIVTATVQSRIVPARISTTGWLAVKPGHEVTTKAAATGFIIPAAVSKSVSLGDNVKAGQSLGVLRVFLTPSEEARLVSLKEETDIRIRQSLVALETARSRLDRIGELSEKGSVAGKERQLARQEMEQARAAYEEVQEELPFLPSEPYERPLHLRDIAVSAPDAGRLTKVHIQSRQLVIQGDPLWTISDWTVLWVRVPVFEGDLSRIDQTEPVEVIEPEVKLTLIATPTGVPQATEGGRRTVDLFYEVNNKDGLLRPGEAVTVELPTGKKARQIVVPKSAILWDGMANAWVYLEEVEGNFRRQRIDVGPTLGQVVVVQQGLSADQSVVTVGAGTLYGEEFKGQLQVLEDDD